MKVVYKNQTKKFKNSENCFATEYRFNDCNDINGAIVEIAGRYPDKGRVLNLECKELAYVIKGTGKIVIEDKEVELQEGDLVLIESGEKYFWDGDLTMFVPCVPAWRPDQHQEVD